MREGEGRGQGRRGKALGSMRVPKVAFDQVASLLPTQKELLRR